MEEKVVLIPTHDFCHCTIPSLASGRALIQSREMHIIKTPVLKIRDHFSRISLEHFSRIPRDRYIFVRTNQKRIGVSRAD